MAKKVILTDIEHDLKNGTAREWRFKLGNKILARLWFPSFGSSQYTIEFRVFGYKKDTLQEAADLVQSMLADTEFNRPFTGKEPFTIEDRQGYPLDLLVQFENKLLQDVAI